MQQGGVGTECAESKVALRPQAACFLQRKGSRWCLCEACRRHTLQRTHPPTAQPECLPMNRPAVPHNQLLMTIHCRYGKISSQTAALLSHL